jgi:hypothetical protein
MFRSTQIKDINQIIKTLSKNHKKNTQKKKPIGKTILSNTPKSKINNKNEKKKQNKNKNQDKGEGKGKAVSIDSSNSSKSSQEQ